MKNFTRQSESTSRESKTDLFVSARFRTEELRELKGPALSVLLAYRSHGNAQGVAWPSLGALAKTTGYGINAIKAARRKLISSGYLIPVEQMREGGEFGRKLFKVSTVGHKQCHGTVAPSTVAPSTVGHKQCQEGSPSQGSPVKGNPANAVRRLVDAELPASSKRFFSPSEKRNKLLANIAGKIREKNDSYHSWIEECQKKSSKHPFGADERQAFDALRYEPDLQRPLLSFDFVDAVVDVFDTNKGKGITPGNLCSKVIDYCETQREKNEGGYYYPPDFQAHRDRLRAEERVAEQIGGRR